MPRISVIVVNWKAADETIGCLRSLAAQTVAPDQVIVVDNGSEDGSVEAIRGAFPEVTLVETGVNLGFGGGANRGLELATGDWIFLLNNDATLAEDGIAELARAAAEAPPTVGMFQSQMVYRSRPDLINSTGIVFYASGRTSDRGVNEPVARRSHGSRIFCPTGGAALYRREMLERVRLASGVLDEEFFVYWEDVDLGWRARLAGYEARYLPTVKVVHACELSSKKLGPVWRRRHAKTNRIRSMIKNASVPFLLFTVPWTLADVAWLVRQDGLGALPPLVRAARGALVHRRRVSEVKRKSRLAVELRWAFGPA